MSTEATYLVAPNVNYKSIDRDSQSPSSNPRYGCLSPSELKPYLDDPRWRLFRIIILTLLVLTFITLLALAVWICYDEYVYNCAPHPVYSSSYSPITPDSSTVRNKQESESVP